MMMQNVLRCSFRLQLRYYSKDRLALRIPYRKGRLFTALHVDCTGTINQFVVNYLLTQFTSVLVIAPGIWRPRFKGGIATIEQMAVVRADAGVQFVLFNSTMDAARVVVEMVRKLQLLVGQVERVTEMLDLLVRILLIFFLRSSSRVFLVRPRVAAGTFHTQNVCLRSIAGQS